MHGRDRQSAVDTLLANSKTLARLAGSLLATRRVPALFDAARRREWVPILDDRPIHAPLRDLAAHSCWMINLEQEWPIYAVRIRSRGGKRRADYVRIAIFISKDKEQWQLIHSGLHRFTPRSESEPLAIHLLEHSRARYVRLEMAEKAQACPCQLEVMVRHHRPPTAVRRLRRFLGSLRSRPVVTERPPKLVDVARHANILTSDRGTTPTGSALARTNPSWMLDLQTEWPLYQIDVHDCVTHPSALASQLAVLISVDGAKWERVLEGVHFFGTMGGLGPLTVRLLNHRSARFVKLELPESAGFDSAKIEVFVEQRLIDLRTCCTRHGFPYGAMLAVDRAERHRYSIEDAPASYDGAINAFHISSKIGRFGNNLKSIANSVCLARRLGVKRIYIPHFSQLEIGEPVEADGVVLLHEDMLSKDRPDSVLSGPFFHRASFGAQGDDITAADLSWAIRTFVRPIFDRSARTPSLVPTNTDLAIHIRSGDLFKGTGRYTAYVQPPLSFYKLIIEHARLRLGTRRAILVYEDELNPCIGALKEWLHSTTFPFVVQSASLAEDIAVLRYARHCVFGHGTFGPAIVCLSDRIETVFIPWTIGEAARSAQFSGVRAVQVRDIAGRYIKPGNWHETPEQYRMMLEYPIENLAIDDAPQITRAQPIAC